SRVCPQPRAPGPRGAAPTRQMRHECRGLRRRGVGNRACRPCHEDVPGVSLATCPAPCRPADATRSKRAPMVIRPMLSSKGAEPPLVALARRAIARRDAVLVLDVRRRAMLDQPCQLRRIEFLLDAVVQCRPARPGNHKVYV